ncbi:MAG: cysteine desulfurase-like protein [Woeseiaceae bacterium]
MTFDLDAVRAQFPALAATDDGKRRIYFDNPAGTQVPATVAAAMSGCLLETNANGGGYFRTSHAAGEVIAAARAAMADFLNAASSDEIIFGQNMTTLTMHVSRSIGRLMRPGDEIIVSRMDHDANIWPWVLLARDLELEIRWLPFNEKTFEFEPGALDELLTDRTRLVCVCGASNLLGTINDVAAMCERARSAGALSYIDAVQSAPHVLTDVRAIGCDFLACSPYKFFGPHQGVLYGRGDMLAQLEPYRVRPAPAKHPGSFETGTPSYEGCAGITAAIEYFAWIGTTMAGATDRPSALRAAMGLLFDYEQKLSARLVNGLTDLDGITVHGITDPGALARRVPTVAFTHDRLASAAIAEQLAADNIFVWSGHNYAVEAARALGIYESGGAVRVGPVHYNSVGEIDETLAALAKIIGA